MNGNLETNVGSPFGHVGNPELGGCVCVSQGDQISVCQDNPGESVLIPWIVNKSPAKMITQCN